MIPTWLPVLAGASLAVGLVLALAVALDEMRRPQQMWIMNVVWPVTVLYGTFLGLWFYARYGRAPVAGHPSATHHMHEAPTPFPIMVAKSTAHCGSGCTVGDLIAEWLAFFVPVIAVWLGYGSVFSEKMFAVWILDFIFAFVLGILFQYFVIKPMRDLSAGRALVEALKADTVSLIFWQIGMYGFMAVAAFVIWRDLFGLRLAVDSVEFWFMMQLAMWCGFITSYPANWWLLRVGVKEAM
jgi:uncharacterized membrane protein YqaE (UPF0057 family)